MKRSNKSNAINTFLKFISTHFFFIGAISFWRYFILRFHFWTVRIMEKKGQIRNSSNNSWLPRQYRKWMRNICGVNCCCDCPLWYAHELGREREHTTTKKPWKKMCWNWPTEHTKKEWHFFMCAIFMSIVAVFSFVFLFHSNKTFVVLFISDIQSEHWLPFSLVCLSNWIAQCVKFAIARANTCLHFGPTMRFSRSPILTSYFSPIQPNFSTML